MTWTTRPRSDGAGDLRFFEAGAGPLLVLIHGVGLRAEAWCGLLPHLARNFRLVCPDMPGHGQSPLNKAETLGDFAGRLSDFIGGFDGPLVLGGHSMGALLAVEVGAAEPDRVAGVVGMNTVYRRSPDAASAVQARARALSGAPAPDPAPTLRRWFGAPPAKAVRPMAEACRQWLTTADPAGYASAYRIFAHKDGPSDTALDRLACPTLFLTGAQDPNSTPAMSRELAARCGGAWGVIEKAAHMMPMTHAAEVARAVQAQLAPAATPTETS